MSLVFLTFAIGVLNLCLGYALAVYLGYAPPSLLDAWDALRSEALPRLQQPAEAPPPPPCRPPEGPLGEPAEEATAKFLEEMLDDSDHALDIRPGDEPYDQEVGEPLGPEDPENWESNEKYVEISVLKLNIAMMKSGAKCAELDTRLRSVQGRCDVETIRQCLAELKEDCETYLVQQREAAERFSERIGELGELRSLGEEIEMANLEQAAQIETTLSHLLQIDFESDPEAGNRLLLEEISKLRVARHKLRDSQEAAFLAVARHEGRLEQIERQLHNDPLTNLRNRIGLETVLLEWWKQGRHRSRQISAVLLDLDAFGRVNEKHGPLLGDRILYHLAELIRNSAGKADLVGRFSGQSFLVAMVDVGPRTATKNAELIRQSIEEVSFIQGDRRIRVTVTCAITEVRPTDTDEAVYVRLQETIKHGKKAGRNRSFFHDGHGTSPVQSPDFRASEVKIRI